MVWEAIANLVALMVHHFNSFFNEQVRESDYALVQFFWKTSVLFGWIKVIFEVKSLFEFLIRHVRWHYLWKSKIRRPSSQSTILKYSDIDPNAESADFSSQSWAVVTGASDGIGAEYCR